MKVTDEMVTRFLSWAAQEQMLLTYRAMLAAAPSPCGAGDVTLRPAETKGAG